MHKFVVLILFFAYANCVSITLYNSQCDCYQLSSEECLQKPECYMTHSCFNHSSQNQQQSPEIPKITSDICSYITDSSDCAKKIGCAYQNQKCEPFAGCVSHYGISNSQCQQYSRKCFYSPSRMLCVDRPTCDEYDGNSLECQGMLSFLGEQLCVYDVNSNKCRKKVCEDIISNYCPDKLQDYFCINNSIYCVNTINKYCKDFEGKDCQYITAIDGPCELNSSSQCQPLSCSNAPQSKRTSDQCSKYHPKCIYNGVLCAEQLVSCTTYTPQDCLSYLGTYGQCQLNISDNTCRNPVCEDFVQRTDELCKSITNNLLNCKSDGSKCYTGAASSCSYFKSGVNDCNSVISQEGRCKEPAEGGVYCQIDKCEDQKFTTFEECNNYSPFDSNGKKLTGYCTTNGNSCKLLTSCKYYVSCNNQEINKIVSMCVNSISEFPSYCEYVKCEDIKDPKSELDCQNKNKLCHFDGFECLENLKYCNDYTGKCTQIKTANQTVCFADGSGFCVPMNSKCSDYVGNTETCKQFKGSDGICFGTPAPGPCYAGSCSDIKADIDSQCTEQSPYCIFDIRSGYCHTFVETCSSILERNQCLTSLSKDTSRYCKWQGDQCKELYLQHCPLESAWCQTGGGRNNPCVTQQYSNSISYQCLDFSRCEDYKIMINSENKTKKDLDEETNFCQAITSRCYSNGETCVPFAPCSLHKTLKNCLVARDMTGKSCTYNISTNICETFVQCTDAQLQTHEECQKYNTSCTSYKAGCVNWKSCDQIMNETECSMDKHFCIWIDNKCSQWNCSYFSKKTHAECQAILPACTTDGSMCINMNVYCQYYTTQESCKVNLRGKKCFFDPTQLHCRDKECSDYSEQEITDCKNSGCAYDTDKKSCFNRQNCYQYTSQTQCDNYNLFNRPCIWQESTTTNINSQCRDFISCEVEFKDKTVCESKYYCYYDESNTAQASCKTVDCHYKNPYANKKSDCQHFELDSFSLTYCEWNQNKQICVEADPSSSFGENCYELSRYRYNYQFNQCRACNSEQKLIVNQTVIPNQNLTNTTLNTTNATNVTSSPSNTSNETTQTITYVKLGQITNVFFFIILEFIFR